MYPHGICLPPGGIALCAAVILAVLSASAASQLQTPLPSAWPHFGRASFVVQTNLAPLPVVPNRCTLHFQLFRVYARVIHSLRNHVMPDYREIHAICNDPPRVRKIATYLLALADTEWTDWEIDFLNDMQHRQDPLSTRQGEIIVDLRDSVLKYDKVDGFVLKTLIDKCYMCRDELAESNSDFIERLKLAGATVLKKFEAQRLLQCARNLREIGQHQGWDFPTRIKL